MAKEDSGRGATGFSGWKADVSLSLLVKAKDSSIFIAWISSITLSISACELYLRVVQCPFSHEAETGGTETILFANFWKGGGTVSTFPVCQLLKRQDNLLHVKQLQGSESLVDSSGCMWMMWTFLERANT